MLPKQLALLWIVNVKKRNLNQKILVQTNDAGALPLSWELELEKYKKKFCFRHNIMRREKTVIL